MYTVIGGDGKEYGPISGEDMGRWLAEGRLNADSLAKAESDAAFRTLATFPEFAHLLGGAATAPGVAPVLATGDSGRQAALDKVRVPAIGLMISAVVSILFIILELFFRSMLLQIFGSSFEQQSGDPQVQQLMQQMEHATRGPVGIGSNIFQLIISILILIGAARMIKLRGYEFSFAAAIMSVIPCITSCCAWPLGLIFGIWAMSVLRKAKPHFS